jgi:hypothetical protein
MSTIQATGAGSLGYVAGTQAVGSGDATQLTTEGLLLYCQTQLGSLDGEIKSMMDEQIRNIDRKNALSTVENAMKKYQPPKTEAEIREVERAFNEAIESLPAGDPTRRDLEIARDNTMRALEPKQSASGKIAQDLGLTKQYNINGSQDLARIFPQHMNKEQWGSYVSEVTRLKENVGANAEINMIQLQSAIAKRQTAIQLTTNMMSKLDQAPAMIAQNLKG